MVIEILKSIFLGIIEGITEWLPISSTGHMLLFDEFIKLNASDEFKEMFFVVIQLGAILAVPVLFFDKLWPFGKGKDQTGATVDLWFKVILGAIPAAIIGFLLDDFFDEHFYNSTVIAVALIVYGIAFIAVEKINSSRGKSPRVRTLDELTYKDAIVIGTFQILSLIPGTSRSGSTILGGMLTGVGRVASAEFSFFMAIPIMIGASGLKILKFILSGAIVSASELIILAVGLIVAFLVSLVVIRFLMDFVKKHSFAVFGYYRIILGAIVLLYFIFV